MKKILVMTVLFFSLFFGTANANNIFHEIQDHVGTDRAAHFAVCYLINDQLARHTKWTPLERFLAIAALGYVKERYIDSKFDRGDMVADCLGALMYEVKF